MNNILFINTNAGMYGSAHSMLDTIDHLATKRYRPIVLLNTEGPLRQQLERRGITVKVVNVIFPLSRMLAPHIFVENCRAWVEIFQFIKLHKVDLIHCYSILALKILFPPLLFSRVAVVQQSNALEHYGFRPFQIVAALLASKVVAVSQAVQRLTVAGVPLLKNRTVCIYNAVDTLKFRPSKASSRLRREWKVPKKLKLVGMVGRIAPVKDHITFLRAAEILLNKHLPVKFVIVGDAIHPELYPQDVEYKLRVLAHIKEKNLVDNVIVAGQKDKMVEVYNSFNLLVLPSTEEAFGRVLIEAKACGVPVIGTNAGGIPEIIDHERTGLLFQPGDAEGLARAIERLFRDKKFYKMLQRNALAEVQTLFRPDVRAKQFDELYSQLLRNVKPRTAAFGKHRSI